MKKEILLYDIMQTTQSDGLPEHKVTHVWETWLEGCFFFCLNKTEKTNKLLIVLFPVVLF